MLVVLDANVLISALLSPEGVPAKILSMVLLGRLTVGYDARIMKEYETVLGRAKFCFKPALVTELLSYIYSRGISVVPPRIDFLFIDEDDKKYYEVAKFCHTVLITGNLRHYPNDGDVVSPAGFIPRADMV